MFCEKCGKKVEPDWKFCKSCGNLLDNASSENNEKNEEEITINDLNNDNIPEKESSETENISDKNAEDEVKTDFLSAETIVIPDDVKFLINNEKNKENAAIDADNSRENKDGKNNKSSKSAEKGFFKKNMKWIIPISAVLLAAIVALIVFLCTRTEKTALNLSDYIDVKVEGYEGAGSVSGAFDAEKVFETVLGKAPDENDHSEEGVKKYYEYITKYSELAGALNFDLSFPDGKVSGSLSDGDKVTVTVTANADVFDKYGYILESPVVVKDFVIGTDTAPLGDFSEMNLLNYIDVSFSGFNGSGKLLSSPAETKTMKFPADNIKQIDITSEVEYSGGDNAKITVALKITAVKKGENGTLIETTFDEEISLSSSSASGLSNGDKFKISVNKDDLAFLETYGIKTDVYEKSFTVEGLQEPVQIDILKELDVSFSGNNNFGNAVILTAEKAIPLSRSLFGISEIKIKVFTKNTNEYSMSLAIPDSENQGKTKTVNIDIPITNYENLSNGDVSTVSIWLEDKDKLEDCGLILTSTSRDIVVSGLPESIDIE